MSETTIDWAPAVSMLVYVMILESEIGELRRRIEWFGIMQFKYNLVMDLLILSASAIDWAPSGPMLLTVKYCILMWVAVMKKKSNNLYHTV